MQVEELIQHKESLKRAFQIAMSYRECHVGLGVKAVVEENGFEPEIKQMKQKKAQSKACCDVLGISLDHVLRRHAPSLFQNHLPHKEKQ